MSDESNNTPKSRLAENNVAWRVLDPNANTSVRNITSTDIDGENVQVELEAKPLFEISWTQSKKKDVSHDSKFGNFTKELDDWKEEKRKDEFALRTYTRIFTDQAEKFTKNKTIYRGLSNEIFKKPIGKIDDIFWIEQFFSCSLDRDRAIEFLDRSDNICSGTLFKIVTNTAIDVRDFSEYEYEEELVIPPLIRFIIKDVQLVKEKITYYEIYMVAEDIETGITYLPGINYPAVTNTDTYNNTKNYEKEFYTALEQEIEFNLSLKNSWEMAKKKYPDKAGDITPAVIYSYTSNNGFYSKLNAELRQWYNHQRMENFLYLNVVLEMNEDQDAFKTCITLRKANGFKGKLVNSPNCGDRNIELYYLNVTKMKYASTVKISGDVAIIWKFPNFKTEVNYGLTYNLDILNGVISDLLNHI